MRVTVLGAGSWGTALTILLARNGQDVILYGHEAEHVDVLRNLRENVRFLPGFAIPREVEIVSDPAELRESDVWVVAVPSSAVRSVSQWVVGDRPVVVLASKGLETGTAQLVSVACQEVVPKARVAALSGPNLAVEIVRGIPTAAVAASIDEDAAETVRRAFMCPTYRVYISDDIVGVEVGGALKNVLAIGAGMGDGLGFGDNTKGTLLARGLHEMTVLGMAMGGRMETFMGISGVGDLFATAVSRLSRNYRVGRALGEGKTLDKALEEIAQVAEGVDTSECAIRLGRQNNLPLPVFEAIDNVLRGRLTPTQAVGALMERLPRREGFVKA